LGVPDLLSPSDTIHFIKRYWFPLALSLCLIALIDRVPSIANASGSVLPDGVSLELPPLYVATSPISRTLDALTLLSNPQSIAIFATVLFITIASIISRRRIRRGGIHRTSVTILTLLGTVALIEAAVAFAPRPMAGLRVTDPDIVTVDLHSHTGASHDVRESFDAEDNRDWHEGGGFDIAYVTDHVTFAGAIAARARNPRLAGEGTSLLTGVEGRYHRIMSTIMLGLDERDMPLLNKRGNILPGTPARGIGPVTIVALPNRNLDSVTVQSLDSLGHFVALELIDAAPRGLGQLDREEARIRRLAADLRLTLVAASNNHGFGRAAAAWNILRIPAWRSMSPDSVGRLIEQPLRNRQLDAVTIIRRIRPSTHDMTLPLTLPTLGFQVIGSLTIVERLVWLLWIWGVVYLMSKVRGSSSNLHATTPRNPASRGRSRK
jgi:hypothetical protein